MIEVSDQDVYDFSRCRYVRVLKVRKVSHIADTRVYKQTSEDGAGWRVACVFPRTIAGYRAAIAVRKEWGGSWRRGPGQRYSNGASIRVQGSRVMVYADGGLDV